jgi:cobalt/nickel transport system permease protein
MPELANLGDRFRDLGTMDALGYRDSGLHRLDPRAKVLATAAFVMAVSSYGRYEVSALLPYTIFPVCLAVLGEVPWSYLLKRIALALPFVLVLGAFNPVLDRTVLLNVGPMAISGGWVSFLSMALKLVLTVASAVVLVAITSMDGVCQALERLGLPQVFVVQIGFLHRYIFVLSEEAGRMLRARELRANGHPLSHREFAPLAGHLLLRTWERAQRIHQAMLARGFEGHFHVLRRPSFRVRDAVFLLGWCALFLVLRFNNLPVRLESMLSGGLR